MPSATMYLDIQHISAGYHARLVLRDLSLRANGGEVLGIIGANGAGKSTLLRVIAGTLAPRAGDIKLTQASLSPVPHPFAQGTRDGGQGHTLNLTRLNAQ